MRGVKVLTFALLIVVEAVSQDAPKLFAYPVPQDGPSSPPVHARCKFSDGKTIAVDYSTRHVKADLSPFDLRPTGAGWATIFNDISFVTDESIITVEGTSVPEGDYAIVPDVHFPMVAIKLIMKTHNGGELRVPMSVTKLALPAENSAISFDHTGGSCMMRVNSKNSNTQLSVEFTEKNADLPVAR
jgi:hypothetical protein